MSPASFENDPNSCLSITSASNEPPLAAYELGEKGILDVAYGTNMKNWLDIAIKYDIPSVKSQMFDISSEYVAYLVIIGITKMQCKCKELLKKIK